MPSFSSLLLLMGVVVSLPTQPPDPIQMLSAGGDEDDCPDRVRVSPDCKNPDPPMMRMPVAAIDDDRPQWLQVSFTALPAEYGITQYQLQESVDFADWETVMRGFNLTWTKLDYQRDVRHAYRVKAFNCRGGYNTEWSMDRILDPVDIIDGPRQPRITNRTFHSVSLKWFEPVEEQLTQTVVEYRRDKGPHPPGLPDTNKWKDWQRGYEGYDLNATVEKLKPNSWYWFRLAYTEATNTRVYSKMVSILTLTSKPFTPHNLEFVDWTSNDKVTANLTWKLENDGGLPLMGYLVEMMDDLDDTYVEKYNGLDRSFVALLSPGRTYTFRASAHNEMGWSGLSKEMTLKCPPKKPGPPILAMDTRSLSSLSIQWQPPVYDGGEEIDTYTLEQADGLGLNFVQVLSAKAYTHQSTGLFKNTVYRYRVAATNEAGQGPWGVLTTKTAKGNSFPNCPGGSGDDTCFKHGACDNFGNCTCDKPYILGDCSGLPCPVNKESNLPCTGPTHGTCDHGTGRCKCEDGWVAQDCSYLDVSHLCPDNCGNGKCDSKTGRCACMSGFAGPNCMQLNCSGIGQCNGHGECVEIGVCECEKGYAGDGCESASCWSLGECNGGGTCVSPEVCVCDGGHVGKDCGVSLCGEADCSGHGRCVGEKLCACFEGWQGDDCDVPVCLNNCSGVGLCEEPGMCTCDEGYAGIDCSTALCPQVDYCNGRGKCTKPNVCNCSVGWKGKKCTDYACEGDNGLDCSGNGECVAPLTCICEPGWLGRGCERADCRKVNKCSRHGNCTAPNNCTCHDGWNGEDCGTPACNLVKGCSGHGECTFPQVCKCDYGFDGVECEIRTVDTNVIIFPSPVETADFQSPLLNDLDAYTVEGWFNIMGVGRRVVMFSQRDVVSAFVTHQYPVSLPPPLNADGNPENPMIIHVECITSAGAAKAEGRVPLSDLGVWHHYAVTVSAKGVLIYVDGGQVGFGEVPQVVDGPPTTMGKSDFGLTLGGGVISSGSDEIPSIKIGDLRVWKVARGILDFRDSMAMFLNDHEPEGSILANLKFADNYGAYAVDTSGVRPPNTARLIGLPRFALEDLPKITPPEPPELLEHVVMMDTAFQVMWEAPTDDGGASVHTYVLEKTDNFMDFEEVYSGPRLDFAQWNLIKGRYYGYRVFAVNFAGKSDPSEVAYMSTIPGVPFAPKRPMGLKENGKDNMTLSFSRPQCNGALLSSYQIQVTDPRTNMSIVVADQSVDAPRIFTVTNLLPGKPYLVRVRGVNKEGEGAWSKDVFHTTNASVPTAPRFTAGGGLAPRESHAVTLQFAPNSDNGAPITQYEVQRKLKSLRQISPLAAAPPQPETQAERRVRVESHRALAASSLLEVSEQVSIGAAVDVDQAGASAWEDVGVANGVATEFKDSTAKPAGIYYYRIRALNDVGEGPWTSVRAPTLAAPPDPPSELMAKGTSPTTGLASWRRSADNGPLTMEYRVYVGESGLDPVPWKLVYNGTALSAPFDMEKGILYSVRAQARNCKGWGPFTDPVNVMGVADKPKAPATLRVNKVAGRAVSLIWTSQKLPLEKVTYVAEGRILVEGVDTEFTEMYAGLDAFATVRDLVPDTTYEFRVAAISMKKGKGEYTLPVTMTTRITPPESPAGLLVVGKTANSLTVTWAHGPDNGAPILRSQVYVGHKDAFTLRLAYDGKGKQARLVGLEPYQMYKIRVRTVNAEGASEYAEELGRTGPPVPSMPRQPVLVSKTTTSIKVKWEPGPAVFEPNYDDSKEADEDEEPKPIRVARWQVAVWAPDPKNYTFEQQQMLALRDDFYTILYDNADLEFDLKNLKPEGASEGQFYYFRARGVGSMGAGRWSPHATIMTSPERDLPCLADSMAPPSLVKAGDDFLEVKWNMWAGADKSRYNGIVEYVVERAQEIPWDSSVDGWGQDQEQLPWSEEDRSGRIDGGAGWVPEELWRGEGGTTKLTGLQSGYTYALRLRISTAVGEGPASSWRVFHTKVGPPGPVAVPYLAARSATELRIEWEQPPDGGSPIKTYTVNIDNETTAIMSTNLTRYFVLKALAPGSIHTMSITTENQDGHMSTGGIGTYETLTGAPYKPPEPNLLGVPEDQLVSIEVNLDHARAAGTPVTAYTLEMRDPLLMVYKPLFSRKLKMKTVVSVLPGQEYAFRTIAHSAAGSSEASNAGITVAPLVVPSVYPPLRMSGITDTTVYLTWDDLTPGENEFEIRMGTDADSMELVFKGFVPEATIADLPRQTTFMAQIRAVNGKGEGPWSEEIRFRTESKCVGDDGSVCSGKGQCVEGVCQCYVRYTGELCEYRTDQGMCNLYGAGHVETFDGRNAVLSPVTGEHVIFQLPEDAQQRLYDAKRVPFKVHGHFRSLPDAPRVTALDSVAIAVGDDVLTLSTSTRMVRAVNNVYVRLNCGTSYTMQTKYAHEAGYNIPNSPFQVRFDFNKRFIVSIDGSPNARVIVQPFYMGNRVFLAAHVSLPQSRRGISEGICGEFQPMDEKTPLLEPWLNDGIASPTWLDQWLIPAVNNITQCPAIENPVFDHSAPVEPPPGPDQGGTDSPSNDPVLADGMLLSLLEVGVEEQSQVMNQMNTNLGDVLTNICTDEMKAAALASCSAVHSEPGAYQACAYDVCALNGGQGLMAAHADSRRTISALKAGVKDVFAQAELDEETASADGTLTGGQTPLPVCPI